MAYHDVRMSFGHQLCIASRLNLVRYRVQKNKGILAPRTKCGAERYFRSGAVQHVCEGIIDSQYPNL